jgi:hypothetical protein
MAQVNLPICVFYHCLLKSDKRVIDPDYAFQLIVSQMDALNRSGLEEAAQNIIIGVNGDESDALAVASIAPNKAIVLHHGAGATTEIPTMNLVREWAHRNPNSAIMYHHTKGVSTPNQQDGWRRRMERINVWGWQECYKALQRGYDCAGAHWLTPEKYPGSITSPFFGGTFWWSKSNYLALLPQLPAATWENRYEAESWIGKGPRPARVVDFHSGWPAVN